MKIATWNVNGIRAREAQVREWVESARPDVLCLQEIKASPSQVPESVVALDGYWCCWHGDKGYSGVGLHISQRLAADRPQFEHPDFDFEHRLVVARLGDLTVASVYVPNGGKDFDAKMRFLEALSRYAAQHRADGRQLVLCGDMNVTRSDLDVHPKERKAGVIGQRPDERALFEQVIGHGLVDVTRALHPDDGELFTWWAPWRQMRQRNIGWRIDYILASAGIAATATAAVSLRETGTSDHAPLVVELGD